MKIGISVTLLMIIFSSCARSKGTSQPAAQNISDTTCNSSNLVFCSGFEEPNWKSVWDDYDGNPEPYNQLIENPGPFNITGNHVMRLRVPPGNGGADIVKVFPQSYDKVYAQWYEYWEPGYDFSSPNHGGGLFAGNRNYLGQSGIRPQGNDFVSAWFEPDPSHEGRPYLYTYYRGMYMDCADPNGQCWGDHFPCFLAPNYCSNPDHVPSPSKLPPPLTAGKWYRIGMMIDMGRPVSNANEANGVLSFWIDGVEYGPWNKLWFRTTSDMKLNILSLAIYFHNQHSTEGVLIDDVAVSTKPF